jgi:hypothetical protein
MKKSKDVIVEVPTATVRVIANVPTISHRGGLPFLHIEAAMSLANQCTELGKKYDVNASLEPTNFQKNTYKACVLGTLFTTVAFLEAAINEVFLDAVESIPATDRKERDARISVKDADINCYGVVESLSSETVKRMAQIWLRQRKIKSCTYFSHFAGFLDRQKQDGYSNVERWSILDKYQAALFLNKKSPFGKGLKRQAAYTLIGLRNYLTHPKPETVILAGPEGTRLGPEKEESADLEQRVTDLIESDALRPAAGYAHEKLFLASPFPSNCLSSGLARMGIKSALEFNNAFSSWMGTKNMTSKYPQLQQQMSILADTHAAVG